jgi:uncharacterized protein DUF6062
MSKPASAKHIGYFELLEAMKSPGCPACRRAEEAVAQSIETLLYEGVNDPGTRHRLDQSFGFCWVHATMVVKRRDVLGTALLYQELVQQFRKMVGRSLTARQRETSRAICPLCEIRAVAGELAVRELVGGLDDLEMRKTFESSDGLCLRHYELARALAKRDASRLASLQAACLDRLLRQLGELIRKQDYRFSSEPVQEEADSWIRAAAAISGLDIEALPPRASRGVPPRKHR